jgi:hypothetical protein
MYGRLKQRCIVNTYVCMRAATLYTSRTSWRLRTKISVNVSHLPLYLALAENLSPKCGESTYVLIVLRTTLVLTMCVCVYTRHGGITCSQSVSLWYCALFGFCNVADDVLCDIYVPRTQSSEPEWFLSFYFLYIRRSPIVNLYVCILS